MATDLKKMFGLRVKHFRNLLSLSQEELAERIGVSSNTISYIERGKNPISFTKLPALSKALEIETYKLFLNTDTETDTKKIQRINKLLNIATPKQLGIIKNIIENVLDL